MFLNNYKVVFWSNIYYVYYVSVIRPDDPRVQRIRKDDSLHLTGTFMVDSIHMPGTI